MDNRFMIQEIKKETEIYSNNNSNDIFINQREWLIEWEEFIATVGKPDSASFQRGFWWILD